MAGRTELYPQIEAARHEIKNRDVRHLYTPDLGQSRGKGHTSPVDAIRSPPRVQQLGNQGLRKARHLIRGNSLGTRAGKRFFLPSLSFLGTGGPKASKMRAGTLGDFVGPPKGRSRSMVLANAVFANAKEIPFLLCCFECLPNPPPREVGIPR